MSLHNDSNKDCYKKLIYKHQARKKAGHILGLGHIHSLSWLSVCYTLREKPA